MTKSRLEAFSDGVLAIILTIMVLELKQPKGATLGDLVPVLPSLATYLLSFLYIGIYWTNHHHMLQSCRVVTGKILWANLHLLFWLSLMPPFTAWLAATGIQPAPVAIYAGIQFMAAVGYYILTVTLVSANGTDSALAIAMGKDVKGKLSLVANGTAVAIAWLAPTVSCGILVLVALGWLVPDRRIERLDLESDAA